MKKTYSGTWKPKHPEKYNGDLNYIHYRSLWERNAFRYLDKASWVKWWHSEETIIPYICATDSKLHRYFVDLTIRTDTGRTLLVEIKPSHQTKPPKRKKLNEALGYMKNISKWKYAKKYCDEHGYEFQIWTEKELEAMGIKTMTTKFKISKTKTGKRIWKTLKKKI
jgi:hypothetical protein|tara:strand:- start:412 stop:909 length:498 start_codon:yes stop_codon:yes gene_type:complete